MSPGTRPEIAVTADGFDAPLSEEGTSRRHRLLFAGSPVPMWLFDPKTLRFLDVNEAAVRSYGYSRGEFLSMTIEDIHQPEDLRRVQADVAARGPGFNKAGLWRHRRKDGTLIDVDIHSSELDLDGRAVRFVFVLDVTEATRAAAQLRDSELRNRTLIDAMHEAVLMRGRDGVIIAMNPSCEQLFGAPIAEALGRANLSSLMYVVREDGITPVPREELPSYTALRTGLAQVGYFCGIRRADGSVRWVIANSNPLFNQGETEPYAVVNSFIDITERKRLEQEREELLERLQIQLERMPIACIILDEALRYSYANPAAERIFGYSAGELLGKSPLDTFVVPQARAEVAESFERLRRGEEVPVHVNENLAADGRRLLIEWTNVALHRADGSFIGVLSMAEDVTARAESERRLRESEERFRIVARATNDAVWDWDFAADTLWWNEGFYSIFGYLQEAMKQGPEGWKESIHPEDRGRVLKGIHAAIDSAGRDDWQDEYRFRRGDGSYADVLDRGFLIRDDAGRAVRMVGGMTDISSRKQAEEHLLYLAHFDSVTGLPNRVLFRDRLQQAIAHAKRQSWQVAVIMIDLDRFKVVNDTLGHSAGDELLRAVGERFSGAIREGDSVARLGGDEFAIILPDMPSVETAAMVAQKLIACLESPLQLAGRELFVSASMGISVFPNDSDDLELLVRNADSAMYRAKAGGRNGYQFFTTELNARTLRMLDIEGRLHYALERGEFVLHYQPKLNVATGRIVGAEALIRWQSTEGLMSPADFIPVLEETGLIVPVGEWVLRTACAQMARWQAEGLAPIPVAVNVSARQFRGGEIRYAVERVLAETGLAPNFLELEITESTLVEDIEGALGVLVKFDRMGVKVAIDDFGTGYSSLAYLKRLQVDSLKIDRSFVRDVNTDPNDAAIVTAVIAMARALDMTVVAEGVETSAQLDYLRAAGCDEYQGYWFSRPQPPEVFRGMLQAGGSVAGIDAAKRKA